VSQELLRLRAISAMLARLNETPTGALDIG
jgi:hypothetical protein